jgi:glycosyltransferase involved in cell wall biosynthesis
MIRTGTSQRLRGDAGLQKVVVFAPTFPPAYLGGGPARTLYALGRDAPASSTVHVLAPSKDADGSALPVLSDTWLPVGAAHVRYASIERLGELRRAFGVVRDIDADVIYLNSFFNLRMSILPQLLARLHYWRQAKILLAPRGEFDRGALAIRPLKKKVYIGAFRLLRLHTRVTWHASAPMEEAAIKAVWGIDARVLVRENETSLPLTADAPTSNVDTVRAAFLGRIAPKKGLLLALDALKEITTPMHFTIYGPEEDSGYVSQCRTAAAALPPNITAVFMGATSPDAVRKELSNQDMLVMPTSGENFGHVIAEALSVSCPVICSDATPWTKALEEGGGIVVAGARASAWSLAIESLASLTPDERLSKRTEAGQAYNRWRSSAKGDHVFELMRRTQPSRSG